MRYYNIAGFNISVGGADSEYFRDRLAEYETEPFEKADLKVKYSEEEKIEPPKGKLTAFEDGYREYYRQDGGYGIFDIHKKDLYIASIEFDEKVTEARMRAVDVVKYGGADNDVRSRNMLGELFRYFMLENSGIVMHASSLMYKGGGIMFSAPSGTGKSTHTALWRECFGDDVTMINDDCPALKFGKDGVSICGTPWSGKTEINHNISAPLKAVVMLSRSEKNNIRRLSPQEALFLVLREVKRPVFEDKLEKTLNYVSELLTTVPVYLLGCNISHEAAQLVKDTVFGK